MSKKSFSLTTKGIVVLADYLRQFLIHEYDFDADCVNDDVAKIIDLFGHVIQQEPESLSVFEWPKEQAASSEVNNEHTLSTTN